MQDPARGCAKKPLRPTAKHASQDHVTPWTLLELIKIAPRLKGARKSECALPPREQYFRFKRMCGVIDCNDRLYHARRGDRYSNTYRNGKAQAPIYSFNDNIYVTVLSILQ